MDEELIKNYLTILEINSYEELRKLGIDRFWQEKFKEINSDKIGSKKKETLLIKINNARDNLNNIDLEELKRVINNANRKKATNNNEANKIKTNKSDTNYTSKKTYQRTEKSPIGIKHPKALIVFFVIVFSGLISIPFIQQQNPYKTANSNSNKKVFKTTYYDNGRYVGDFINGERTGKGTYYFNNGDRYEGDFINGERRGKGTYYFNNGERYKGDFLKGNFHGYGTYYWTSGARYSGYWLDSKRNGYGTYSDSSGYSEKQHWNNGQLQR